MPHTEIYLHIVFAVKKRRPVLTAEKRPLLFQHITEQTALHQIDLKSINGFDDHIHMLLRFHASQTLATLVQQIKGESARWANQANLFDTKLTWATGYYARSVDPQNVELVTRYIASQPSKHGTIIV
jgi:putative transposase